MRTKHKELQLKMKVLGSIKKKFRARNGSAFTLIELLVVITIIAILGGLLFPALTAVIATARAATASIDLKNIAGSTLEWSMDHGNKLPSAQYPGGHMGELPEYAIPEGTRGLWLDGVIFKTMYPEGDPSNPASSRAEDGGHLIGTSLENKASVKAYPDVLDWYEHSYAMNTSLVYDELNKKSPDPYLTEKSIVNLDYGTAAMLFIDAQANMVDYDMAMAGYPEESIFAYAAERYRGKYVIVAYVDGHVEKLKPSEIPMDDIYTDPDSSRFWRGVNPKSR